MVDADEGTLLVVLVDWRRLEEPLRLLAPSVPAKGVDADVVGVPSVEDGIPPIGDMD